MAIFTNVQLVDVIKDTVIYSSDISKIEAVMEVLAAIRNKVNNEQQKQIYTKAIKELFDRTVILQNPKESGLL